MRIEIRHKLMNVGHDHCNAKMLPRHCAIPTGSANQHYFAIIPSFTLNFCNPMHIPLASVCTLASSGFLESGVEVSAMSNC